jgi:hypothetical protein
VKKVFGGPSVLPVRVTARLLAWSKPAYVGAGGSKFKHLPVEVPADATSYDVSKVVWHVITWQTMNKLTKTVDVGSPADSSFGYSLFTKALDFDAYPTPDYLEKSPFNERRRGFLWLREDASGKKETLLNGSAFMYWAFHYYMYHSAGYRGRAAEDQKKGYPELTMKYGWARKNIFGGLEFEQGMPVKGP